MNNRAHFIDRLRDIVLPVEPSIWPLAPGWWLAALIMTVSVALLFVWIRDRLAGAARRSALKQLAQLAALPPRLAIAELSVLMRRVALTRYPRSQVASLVGHDWLAFLDRSGATDQFTSGPGKVLATGPYSSRVDEDCERVLALCRQWISRVL